MTTRIPGTALTVLLGTAASSPAQPTQTTQKAVTGPATLTRQVLKGAVKFDADATMLQAMELEPHMKVSATKIAEVPETVVAHESVVPDTTKK